MDTVAYRLKYAMQHRNMRNADIVESAQRLGFHITTSSVSQWCNGDYVPKQDKITVLARCLNVPALWLAGVAPIEDIDGLQEDIDVVELALLSAFRQLNKHGKDTVIQIVNAMVGSKDFSKRK